jgi:hypothetical protein
MVMLLGLIVFSLGLGSMRFKLQKARNDTCNMEPSEGIQRLLGVRHPFPILEEIL